MGICFSKKKYNKLYCDYCGFTIEYDIYLSGDSYVACSQLCQCKLNKKNNIYAPI